MKHLNVEEYQVTELNYDEMTSTIGGGWWSDFKAGFKEGFKFMFDFIDKLSDIFPSK